MHRIDKINEEVRRAISAIITELKDPRISDAPMISVCHVDVTTDLKHAKVFVSVLGSEVQKVAVIEALVNAKGFIKKEVGARVALRAIPEFKFLIDNSIEHGAHINNMLKGMINKESE